MGCDQLLKVPDGVISAGRRRVKENGRERENVQENIPGLNAPCQDPTAPSLGLTKVTVQHRLSCRPHVKHPGNHCLPAAGGYLHLTRTFFPRRSLQTTSIILSGATHGVGWKAAESGLQGSPKTQDSGFESYVYPSSTSQIRVLPGLNSQDGGPQAAAPPHSGRRKAPPRRSQARTPLRAGSHQFPPIPDLSTRPLTSKRLEPADATTSSLEGGAGVGLGSKSRKRK